MRYLYKTVFLMSVLAFLLVSCSKDEKMAEPVLVIDQESVDVPSTGGTASVTYSLENPVEGERFSISADDEWVGQFNQDEEGVISFEVGQNTGQEARETAVVVKYAGITAGFTVRQNAAGQDSPVFVLEKTEVTVGNDGGNVSVGYTLQNPVDGAEVESKCEAQWISGIVVDEETISFDVAKNDGEGRDAEIEFVYAGVVQKLKVIQGEDSEPFSVSVENVTETTADIVVTPADPVMSYLIMAIEKEEIDKYSTDEELFSSILYNFEMAAMNYGMTLESFLIEGQVLSVGKATANITMLKVSCDHVAIAVGMDYDGEMLTGIVRENFRTKDVEMIDITFDINYVVDGPEVEMSVSPSISDQLYFFNALQLDKLDSYEASLEEVMQDFLDEQVSFGVMFGSTPGDVVRSLCSVGDVSERLSGMLAGKEYVGFAFSVTESGVINSAIARKNFTTGLAEPSDNRIYVQIPVVSLNEASYSITTTNDDPYVFLVVSADGFEGLNDDQIIDRLINSGLYDVSRNVFNGNNSGTANGLTPGTKYLALAFGYEAGMATTGLTKVEFSTYADTGSDFAQLNIEVTEITSSKVYFTVTGTPESAPFICGVAAADATSESVIDEMKAYVDQLISQGSVDSFAMYFKYNAKKGSYSTNKNVPADEFKVYAFGVDMSTGDYDTDITFTEILTVQ